MKKIILDTNVLVSSLIQRNYPYLIVKYCIDGNAIICLSDFNSARVYRSS